VIVAVCGDSFFATDKNYRGMHWSEQLGSQHEVYNLARPGASNFSIWHQVMQTAIFKPDLILISFTNCPRVEYVSNEHEKSNLQLNSDIVLDALGRVKHLHNVKTKLTNEIAHATPHSNTEVFDNWARLFYIETFEILKNFLYISATLDFLQQANIPYRATLGGFDTHRGKQVDNITMDFSKWQECLDLPNGWQFAKGRMNSSVSFHIDDAKWHNDHAKLVLELLER
jgi:uncharacterized protein YbdZ (MbtH family)